MKGFTGNESDVVHHSSFEGVNDGPGVVPSSKAYLERKEAGQALHDLLAELELAFEQTYTPDIVETIKSLAERSTPEHLGGAIVLATTPPLCFKLTKAAGKTGDQLGEVPIVAALSSCTKRGDELATEVSRAWGYLHI